MHGATHLSEAELADIRRRRRGVRASLACEGIYLTPDEEALFSQFDRERLTSDQRRDRLLAHTRQARRDRVHAAD